MKNYIFVFAVFVGFLACNGNNNTISPNAFFEMKINGEIYKDELNTGLDAIISDSFGLYTFRSAKTENGQRSQFFVSFHTLRPITLPSNFEVIVDTSRSNNSNAILITGFPLLEQTVGITFIPLSSLNDWKGSLKFNISQYRDFKITGTLNGQITNKKTGKTIKIESGKFENVPFTKIL